MVDGVGSRRRRCCCCGSGGGIGVGIDNVTHVDLDRLDPRLPL